MFYNSTRMQASGRRRYRLLIWFRKCNWAFLLFVGVAGSYLPVCEAEISRTPFSKGEKLLFHLRWGVVSAGEATLEVVSDASAEDSEQFRFVMTAKTTPFIDRFYKVRNRMESITDRGMTRSLFFDKNQNEGRSRKASQVRFDWIRNESCYFSQQRCKYTLSLPPGTFDPLSAFYYVRSLPLEDRFSIQRPVTDGKKCILGRARVLRREMVTVPMGTFDTYLLEPEIEHVGGVFKKSKGARIHIWVTADERKIPVRLQSKVIIGSFVGELVSANGLTPLPAKESTVTFDR